MKKLAIAGVAFLLVAILALFISPPRWEFTGLEAQIVAKPVPAFKVEIGGRFLSINSISDIKVECEVTEVFEGDRLNPRKIPGRVKYSDITLKRGVLKKAEDVNLLKWYQDVINGKLEKKSGSIIVYDLETGEEYQRYNFFEAWPCKWYGPRMVGSSTVIPMEEITLAIEKFEIAVR